MVASGVTPMPPATSTEPPGPVCSGKSFFGGSMAMVSPSFSPSCMKREPPRPSASLRTAITYSVGALVALRAVSKLMSE